MSEFKGTKGNIQMMIGGFTKKGEIPNMIQIYATNEDLEMICKVYKDEILHNKNQDFEANANLIVDAFKVRQQINCELSELLEQRNDMLWMLEVLISHYRSDGSDELALKSDIDLAQQLIKKVKDNE